MTKPLSVGGMGSSRDHARSITGGRPQEAPSPTLQGYIVIGSTGEYSRRHEWPVRVFLSEGAAQAHVEFLTAKRMELPAYTDLDWGASVDVEDAMRVFDPGYSEDYTGTSWRVSPVLVDLSSQAAGTNVAAPAAHAAQVAGDKSREEQ